MCQWALFLATRRVGLHASHSSNRLSFWAKRRMRSLCHSEGVSEANDWRIQASAWGLAKLFPTIEYFAFSLLWILHYTPLRSVSFRMTNLFCHSERSEESSKSAQHFNLHKNRKALAKTAQRNRAENSTQNINPTRWIAPKQSLLPQTQNDEYCTSRNSIRKKILSPT